jgi:hypothetical protein
VLTIAWQMGEDTVGPLVFGSLVFVAGLIGFVATRFVTWWQHG